MSDTIERTPAPTATNVDQLATHDPQPRGWTRNHTIGVLVALSLVPGLVAAGSRDWWHTLPASVRLPAYVGSGVLILAACWLILVREQAPPADQP